MSDSNILYYGDNLNILRRYIPNETIDLIYLDPPFNSAQSYNVLFAEKNGSSAASQIKAFEDTWHWDQIAAETFYELVHSGGLVSETMQAFRKILGENDMLAYLSMMAPRLVELHRVLKSTGSLYLHCDCTASRYLSVLLDAVFGRSNFQNIIIWKRTSARSDSKRWNHIHDDILYYTKSENYVWNPQYLPYNKEYIRKFYRHVEKDTGRRYTSSDLTASGISGGESGLPWRGIDVRSKKNHWKFTITKLEELDRAGRILWPKKPGGMPRYKRYLDEMPGIAYQSMITDVPPLSAFSKEKLGYPTQKPQVLLERIILSSSNEGDVVLDPFCGCGTTVIASQQLKRRWIGIDITHLAISLVRHRLRDTFGESVDYQVLGEPVSLPDAVALAKQDPYQFQWWALGLIGARPIELKKGADKGIDGKIFFQVAGNQIHQILISVKSGHVSVSQIRDLRGVLEREQAAIGILITLELPTPAMRSEAAAAGFYEAPGWNQHYPRIQIRTIEELMSGKRIEQPPDNQTFKRAPKSKRPVDLGPLLF